MNGRNEPDAWQLAKQMVAVSRSHTDMRSTSLILLSAAVAIGNLFFSVLFEDPIKQDPGGRALSDFLLIQSFFVFLATLSHLASSGKELLHKSLVMPVTPSCRLAFAFLSSVRHPVLQAFIFSLLFFLFVLFHHMIAGVILVLLLAALMVAGIVALTSLACTAAIRRARPPSLVAAYGILGFLAILVIALMTHMPGAIGMLPPVSWTTRGIISAVGGDVLPALACSAAGIGLLALVGILGRKFA
jgi:hypothetical protein